jgi:hypothetical protein
MTRVACMGGWCAEKRDNCRLYHNTDGTPIERVCEAGTHDCFEPIRIVRAPGTWERQHTVGLLAPATWADAIH